MPRRLRAKRRPVREKRRQLENRLHLIARMSACQRALHRRPCHAHHQRRSRHIVMLEVRSPARVRLTRYVRRCPNAAKIAGNAASAKTGSASRRKSARPAPSKRAETSVLNVASSHFVSMANAMSPPLKPAMTLTKPPPRSPESVKPRKALATHRAFSQARPMKCSKKRSALPIVVKMAAGAPILASRNVQRKKKRSVLPEKGLTIYIGGTAPKKSSENAFEKSVRTAAMTVAWQNHSAARGAGAAWQNLRLTWHPTCAPITPEELASINFEHIDFTEFYPEMHSNTQLPDPSHIQQRLQSAMQP